MKWVRVTPTSGTATTFVNLGLAMALERDGNSTTIRFAGTSVNVVETPEKLFQAAGGSQVGS